MATYLIGDIQGCFRSFQALLKQVQFDPKKDTLFLLGDLVNRGPGSLATLRWIVEHESCVQTVLGNHDCLLLHCAWNKKSLRPGDTIDDILEAEDCDELVDWVSQRPLLFENERFAMVHAGLHPHWTWSMAHTFASEIHERLTQSGKKKFLKRAFEMKGEQWGVDDKMEQQLLVALNIFSRIRVCDELGRLDYKYKSGPDELGADQYPWYSAPERETLPKHLFFGHWSALGLYQGPQVTCLDTGCVWGRQLTALRYEDKKVFSQDNLDV